MRAIDTCSFVFPTKEILKFIIRAWGIYEGYLNMFAKNIFSILGMPANQYMEKISKTPKSELIEELATLFTRFEVPLDDFVEMLDESGVEKAVHVSEDTETTTRVKPVSNDYIAKITSEYPDKLLAFAGVDPNKGDKAREEAERALTQLELNGIALYPFKHELPPDDEKYYPIYEVAIRYKVPVWFHASVNWNNRISMYIEHPRHFDNLASIFPELKIILGHAGWPWVGEAVTVAWRHPNVYIELSAFRPKYVGKTGSGFETLIYYGNTVARDKVLWGSTWLLLGMQHSEILEEMSKLPIKPEALESWLYHNARRVLSLK